MRNELEIITELRLAALREREEKTARMFNASMVRLTMPELAPGIRGMEFDAPQFIFIRTKLTDALLSTWYCDAIQYHESRGEFIFKMRGATIGLFRPLDADFMLKF